MMKFLNAVSIPLTEIYRRIKVPTCKCGTYLSEKQQRRRPERSADEVKWNCDDKTNSTAEDRQ